MVGEVAALKLVLKTGGIGAVPAVTAHDNTGEAGVTGSAYEQRHGIQEAGVVQELSTGGHGLCGLGAEVGIGGHALANVGNLNAARLAVLNESVLQTVGVVIVLGVDHGNLANALALDKHGSHLALIGIDEAVTEDGVALQGNGGVGSAGSQQQHAVLGGLLSHGQGHGGEEAAHQRLGAVRHDLIVGVHGLLGILGIVGDLTAIDNFNLILGIAGVDFLNSHIHGILGTLAINGGAAGHGADYAYADYLILGTRGGGGGRGSGAIRGGSGGSGGGGLGAGGTAGHHAGQHEHGQNQRNNLFHNKPSL